jgi:signal recognition particle subunit SRP54
MFENLSDSIGNVFSKLKGKGFLNEADITAAMREVRIALLEADVSLPIVKKFIANIKEKATGEEIVKSVSPAQMVIKIVQDELEAMLGSESYGLNLNVVAPAVIMMAGLQGSGKTTSAAKIANVLKTKQSKKVLMASLDVYRPAAQEQLATLGKQISIDTLEIIEGQKPEAIAKRAMKEGKLGGYDVLFIDTAGRLHIDDELMSELQAIEKIITPSEILLVADSLTGQDAVTVATQFNEKVGVTGIVLTRIDGDARGGAALSMRSATGCPIKFLGTGEKISEIEAFHPSRIASRILGMGDVVSLVERAAEAVDEDEAKKLEKKMRKGMFDMDDLSKQLDTINKMGGLGSMMGMLPGVAKYKDQIAESGMDDKRIKRQQAMISSMTKPERRDPKILNGSRKRRIAGGAGGSVQELNQLLKQFKQMQTMMKKMSKLGKKGMMRAMGGMMGGAGGMPPKI